jgi:thiamine biosynthesis lipoprotein
MKQLLSIPAFLLLTILLSTCDPAPENSASSPEELPLQTLTGEAMGTYYRILYLGEEVEGLVPQIDSLLDAFNQELSAWVPGSLLNQFNESEGGIDLTGSNHFIPNLELARRISVRTQGAYDPTIAPLVKYWGFGGGERRTTAAIDSAEVDRLLELVVLDELTLEEGYLTKPHPEVQLDLNASAKGYGVDLLADLLEKNGRENYLIDVGGEFRAGGDKNGRPWRVAIRLPEEDATTISQAGTLPLAPGQGIATSGNYLNYYKVEGETFSHTINPRTGYVERNALLSASVLAPDCATADAYATACMVLGPKAALELINETPNLEGYFLVGGEDGLMTTVVSNGLKNID